MNDEFSPRVLAHWPGRNMCSGNVYDKNNICQTLMACLGTGGNNQPLIKENIGDKNMDSKEKSKKYAIRKLTERECWRLMGFSDEDFDNAKKNGMSKTQLYKQAGNSRVKQGLMAVFLQLGIQGKPRWNDMSVEERRKLVYKGTVVENR